MINPLACTECLCGDGDNREFQRNDNILTDSSLSEAISIQHMPHDAVVLKSRVISPRSKSTEVNLGLQLKPTNLSPMPSVCINPSLLIGPGDMVVVSCHTPIQIFIRTIQGTTTTITIDSNSSNNHLKQAIYARDGIHPRHQRLLRGGREYSDGSRLSELCVSGDSMTLLVRLMGGNPEDNPKIMPVTWWIGFACSHQDGRVDVEGRICHVLSDFEFDDSVYPHNWHSDRPLSKWSGIHLIASIGTFIYDLTLTFLQIM